VGAWDISNGKTTFTYHAFHTSASSKVITCNANKNIRDNIANIFGAKVVSQIIPVDLSLSQSDAPTAEEDNDGSK
jgi:hypothetical protein